MSVDTIEINETLKDQIENKIKSLREYWQSEVLPRSD